MEKLPLVGLMEIAQAAGVKRPVVSMWRNRYEDFPQPVAELHTGPVFWWPLVKGWLKDSGRDFEANWSLERVRPPGRTWPGTSDPRQP